MQELGQLFPILKIYNTKRESFEKAPRAQHKSSLYIRRPSNGALGPSRKHLKNIGRVQDDICRFCNMESKTPEHLLCSCGALLKRRSSLLGSGCLQPKEICSLNPGKEIGFINHNLPDWERVGAGT